MYSWEKSLREERSRNNPKNPSFSSSLLDEIYRSIDGYDEKGEEWKLNKERSHATSIKKHNGGRAKSSSIVEDEEMASLKRACLIEKWMEKKVHEKVSSQRKELDNDPLFFSSGSSSSDSSSGGLSSSDTEFFASIKTRKSCFASSRPKLVRTSVSPRRGQQKNEFLMFSRDQESVETEENLIKSKSRALKIYANLKKVKQPISPGGRLTSFINNLFTNGHSKKSKACSEEANVEKKKSNKSSSISQVSSSVSTCSSASSFSRSCLSRSSPNSRAKLNNGAKRTVRFCPVSVIVDEDCRPCGHKSTYDQDSDRFGKPPLMSQNSTVQRKTEGAAAAAERDRDNLKAYHQNHKKENFAIDRMIQDHHEEDYDDDDEDAASDSSSDLFEIDHLALFGNNRFCEELPVYETTHLDTNRAIASGLIR
ncbi:protein BIG GRAIN 1-like A [Coffea eugenioides]|uniref:protein BIG GRAIN 1-like A n=1 Tax=Coffea eugenioides TaxID=49369 RepID=UPI000F60AD2C|nr:protein BIG GRAIN 1-like A [Coffea eugenioides]